MLSGEDKVEIIPVAGKMYSTLRNSGYDNVPAIEDLMDNSIDANAKNIWVFIDNLDKIIIADDGIGMSYDVLRDALRLGGRKDHNKDKDLGKYGFGLITGSISLGSKFSIITKNNGHFHTAIVDCEEIYKANDFIATVRESSELEKLSFDERTNYAESGTVLIIDNCDKIQYGFVDSLVKELKNSIKRVYRDFMRDGKRKIFINGIQLQVDDPLMLSNPQTQVRLDKTVDISLDNGDIEKLHIIAVTVPVELNVRNIDKKTNLKTQGFYMLRNNREIAAAVEIPEVFKKHNDYNLFRIELQFTSGLDDEMNVNFSKHDVTPSSRIVNILNNELADIAHKVRDEAKERQKRNSEKRKQAKNPFIGGDGQPKQATTGSDVVDGKGENGSETIKGTPIFEGVKISKRFKTEKDALFNVTASLENATLLYNCANVFYRDKLIDGDEGLVIRKILDLTMESMISACVENGVAPDKIEKISEYIARALENNKG